MIKAVNFLAASLLTNYPDELFAEYLEGLIAGSELSLPENLKRDLCFRLKDQNHLEDLRSEYIDLFDRGSSANSLYETEYGRNRAIAKGMELADLSGFYKAFGFEFGDKDSPKEMRDHVSVELEFYALILMKQETLKDLGDQQGIEVVMEARKKFLKDHLGRFVGAIADRPAVRQSSFYSLVFNWCRDVIARECEHLEVKIIPVSWVSGQQEKENILCGNAGCSG